MKPTTGLSAEERVIMAMIWTVQAALIDRDMKETANMLQMVTDQLEIIFQREGEKK